MGSRSRGRIERGIQATSVPSRSLSSPDSGSGKSAAVTVWPRWARVLVSLAVVLHLFAIVAGALGVPPSSLLERTVADPFTPYYDLMDLGYSYRYYAEPPPTSVSRPPFRLARAGPTRRSGYPRARSPAPGCVINGNWPSRTRFSTIFRR